MPQTEVVQKLWNYCNILRGDGMSYDDCVEQLTNLLFLKMVDERSPSCNQVGVKPEQWVRRTELLG